MIFGIVGEEVYENFSVTDGDNTLVSGIPNTEFTADLYDPVANTSSVTVSITELGNGHYRSEFIPDKTGTWYIIVYHDEYFPWGKSDDVLVYNNDFDKIADDLTRVLGLTQENYYLDETAYTSYQGAKLLTGGRIRIYSNASSVGTINDVMATYKIESDWNNDELQTYKVTKV